MRPGRHFCGPSVACLSAFAVGRPARRISIARLYPDGYSIADATSRFISGGSHVLRALPSPYAHMHEQEGRRVYYLPGWHVTGCTLYWPQRPRWCRSLCIHSRSGVGDAGPRRLVDDSLAPTGGGCGRMARVSHRIRMDTITLSRLFAVPVLSYFLLPGEPVSLQLSLALFSWPALLVHMELHAGFIAEFDTRPNRLFFEYLRYPREVFGTLLTAHPMYPLGATRYLAYSSSHSIASARIECSTPASGRCVPAPCACRW